VNKYALTHENSQKAIKAGLAEANWYTTPVSRDVMRATLERKDFPAIRDTIIWFGLMSICAWAFATYSFSYLGMMAYGIYAVLYGTASDSRWHECSHGTAFKTDWMNALLYEISSFMVMRESIVWKWSHVRHHSDTIVVGRDPEIQIPRPTEYMPIVKSLINLGGYQNYYKSLFRHAGGQITEAESLFIPVEERDHITLYSRVCLAIYASILILSLVFQTWIPIFLFILPQFFGTWLMIIHNSTQHAGLAENDLDHRLNCRTVYMNPLSRFIYWNMNYHVEHHMFPLVPYHALPKLHREIKDDCPPPYSSILEAWKEILPAIIRQKKDPTYFVNRPLPEARLDINDGVYTSQKSGDHQGWDKVCLADQLKKNDVIRFNQGSKTFAIAKLENGDLHATDGICTHGNTHLAEGMVKDGIIECPKHNGRFNLKDGSPARAPICRGLGTYPVKEMDGHIHINTFRITHAASETEKLHSFKVISNKNVATFIKELILEPLDGHNIDFVSGDYLQFQIPQYSQIDFNTLDIQAPYAEDWENMGLFNVKAEQPTEVKLNNYSLASVPKEKVLRFNVRLALSAPGKDHPPGVGSSYMFQLKEGDIVQAMGAYGDFHIKETKKEMIYIGGGAGMAPLSSHIHHLLDDQKSERKISFWYGARSPKEMFYKEEFEQLNREHEYFDFHLAYSESGSSDIEAHEKMGYVHDVLREEYLKHHHQIENVEFYLCGPPAMIKACTVMLKEFDVNDEQISYDEF
jgi:Na+-transporting NADH:ubiquinone oxidoreductase subunit F